MCETENSVGGFLDVSGSGRIVRKFNVGWRFYKGAADGAESAGFDANQWTVVNVPHGLEIMPLEATPRESTTTWVPADGAVRSPATAKRPPQSDT